jgi:hypothetical protein
MHSDESADDSRPLVSNRTADIVVAMLLLVVCGIVIYDSSRSASIGSKAKARPGLFPVLHCCRARRIQPDQPHLRDPGPGPSGVFVAMRPFGRVLAVLIPAWFSSP